MNHPQQPVTNIGRAEAARRVRAEAGRRSLEYHHIDMSVIEVARGRLFDMASRRVLFPVGMAYDRCWVALIDTCDRNARWGHPAHWAFVPVAGDGEVVIVDTDMPESAMGSVRMCITSP